MPQNKLKRDAHLGSETQLPGLPGFRTRQGRSGYDPLDTNREVGRMEGTFYRNLFTLRLRTRNPFYLAAMFIIGAALSVLMSVALYGFITAPKIPERSFVFYLSIIVTLLIWVFILCIGLGLLVNLFLSLGMILGIGKQKTSEKRRLEKERKKLPKRRKDFR